MRDLIKKHGLIILVAILFLFRLSWETPKEELAAKIVNEHYYTYDGRKLNTDIAGLGHIVFFYLPDNLSCSSLTEIISYKKMKKAFPETDFSLLVHDPDGNFTQYNPKFKERLLTDYSFDSPIYFDRTGCLLKRYNSTAESKVFIFNKQMQQVTILRAEGLVTKKRTKLYYDLLNNL